MSDVAFAAIYLSLLAAGLGLSVRFVLLWFRITRRPVRPLRMYRRVGGRMMSTNLEGNDWQEVPGDEREGVHQ